MYLNKSNKYMILDWLHFILEFDFYIVHRKGVTNVLPDKLSRLYEEPGDEKEESDDSVVFDVHDLEVESEKPEGLSNMMREMIKEVAGKEEPPDEKKKELVVEKHRESHIGGQGLFQALFRDGYYWKGMRKMCEEVARGCEAYLKYNVGRAGFHPISPVTATLPFDHIAIDLAGPLPTSESGFNYILVLVDIATRFVLLRPLQTKEAEEIAWTLLTVFADFGLPKVIQHDNDRSFLNQIMERFREQAEFIPRAVMKYFPAQNGAVERFVGETKTLLLKLLSGDTSNWERFLPVVQLSLNDRILGRHGSSSFACMFARRLNTARDYTDINIRRASVEALLERNRKMVEVIYPALEERSREKAEKECETANNRKRRGRIPSEVLPVQTRVMKTVDVRQSKLQQRWEGPFVVVGYNPKTRGYRLVDATGAMVKDEVPRAHLKVICGVDDSAGAEYGEVKRVLNHRGSPGNREYYVEWKGGSKSWIHASNFQAHDCLRDYWKKKNEKRKEKDQENESDSDEEFVPARRSSRSGRRRNLPGTSGG